MRDGVFEVVGVLTFTLVMVFLAANLFWLLSIL